MHEGRVRRRVRGSFSNVADLSNRLQARGGNEQTAELLLELAELNARTAEALAAAVQELHIVQQTSQALFDQARELLEELRRSKL